MKRMIPVVAVLACSMSGLAAAQQDPKDQKDRAVTTETEVDVDDGRAMTISGCLVQVAGRNFAIRGGSIVESDEVETRTRVERDVDDDGTEVTRTAENRTDHDDARPVGTSGLVATYELT